MSSIEYIEKKRRRSYMTNANCYCFVAISGSDPNTGGGNEYPRQAGDNKPVLQSEILHTLTPRSQRRKSVGENQ